MTDKKKIRDFVPQVKNPNLHNTFGMRLLEKSIQNDGWIGAQTAAKDGEIIAGSARQEIAIEKFTDKDGKEVEPIIVESDGSRPVIIVRTDIENADTARARRLSAAENQIAKSNYNPDFELLKEWGGEDEQIKKLFSDDEWREGTGEEKPQVDAEPQIDRAAELAEKWQTKSGQLWRLGEHRLLIGDCTVRENVERLMGGERAKLAPVDPPYNVGFDYDGETVDDEKTEEKYKEFCHAWFSECQRVSDKQIVTAGCYNLPSWLRWFDSYHVGTWIKSNSMTNGRVSRFWCWEPVIFFGEKFGKKRTNDIFDYPIGQQKDVANHPCPKPLKMWIDLIENYSELNDIIYECFGGSGTTLIACIETKRICRIMEISEKYSAVILERYFTATGITPELVG